jgi:hypothetical protein
LANKRLYTESDVAALPRGATIALGKEALATPAAIDLAFARGVRVSYGEAPAAAGGEAGALQRMLAQPGTYVVSVQPGGAAVIARLEAGLPVPFGNVPAGVQ